jgi:quercetin dioxygenase-like cupin family protein
MLRKGFFLARLRVPRFFAVKRETCQLVNLFNLSTCQFLFSSFVSFDTKQPDKIPIILLLKFYCMISRKQFLSRGSVGLFSTILFPLSALPYGTSNFEGLVIHEEEGESVRMRDGSAIVKIKIAKTQGSDSIAFLSESFMPGDALPVHKHLNEDELIFLHRGSGSLTLGEKEYQVKEGAVVFIPKGIWHGLKNTGTENIEMRFAYTPSGFENFFREVGTPVAQPFVQKTMDERRAIAKRWGMIYKM